MEEFSIDKSREIVDKIFEKLDMGARPSNKISSTVSEAGASFDSSSESMVEFAKEKALEEIEQIRSAFIEFQDNVKDLVLFNYMTNPLEQLAEYALNLTETIEDNIDESKLSPETLRKYKSIKKLRAQILSNVYNKYKKKGGK